VQQRNAELDLSRLRQLEDELRGAIASSLMSGLPYLAVALDGARGSPHAPKCCATSPGACRRACLCSPSVRVSTANPQQWQWAPYVQTMPVGDGLCISDALATAEYCALIEVDGMSSGKTFDSFRLDGHVLG
jgi:hypothetical protein